MGLRSLRHARDASIALALMLAAGTGDAAPGHLPARHARIVEHAPPRPLGVETASAARASWTASLLPIAVKNRNTNAHATIRLYTDDGGLDRGALRTFMRVAASAASSDEVDPIREASGREREAEPLAPRLVQLAFRAAYHFKSSSMVIVSATRKGAHGKHGSGKALDFQLEGVTAAAVAAYARTYPRAGVGIYTHPKTQYVHVDVRGRSYHWIDGSPPGVTWREKLLADPGQPKRDDSYVPSMDLPEAAMRD